MLQSEPRFVRWQRMMEAASGGENAHAQKVFDLVSGGLLPLDQAFDRLCMERKVILHQLLKSERC